MDQDIAVRTMMLSVKAEDQIPEEYQSFVRKYLSLMWVVGFEERGKYIGKNISKKRMKPVCQLSGYRKLIDTFPSVKIAAKKTHHCAASLYAFIKSKEQAPDGYYWVMKKDYDNEISTSETLSFPPI